MAKDFTYRGKSIEELKNMELKEFMKLLPSRKKRSLKRGFTEGQQTFLKKIDKALQGKIKKPIKTHVRDMIVLPKMVGLTIHIHSGKSFAQVMIQPEMIGMYLGELTMTRSKITHSAPGVGATRSSSAISVK